MGKFRYILKRFSNLIPVLLGISLVSFGLLHLTPGDPAEILLQASGIMPSPEAVEALRVKLGLSDPLYLQYIHWLERILRFDLGCSFDTGTPVAAELWQRFPATLELAFGAMGFTLLAGVLLGILAAFYRNTWLDRLSRLVALLGASMPSFWVGLLLIYFISVRLHLLPVIGKEGFWHLILPAVTLGLHLSPAYIRLLRTSMVEVMEKEYIVAARARGLKEILVIGRHALKNALLPVITLFGINFGGLLGGSVVVETVFSWPGIGKYAVDSIFRKDYPVIQGYVLFMALVFVLMNLLVDFVYVILDPRIRLERRRVHE